MLAKQGFECASCGDRLYVERHRGTHVDHCHKSGAIRGILCADCNVSLGRMKENPERIRRLANYAEKIAKPTNASSFSPPPTAFGGGGEKERAIPKPTTNHGE